MSAAVQRDLSGWGRYPHYSCTVVEPDSTDIFVKSEFVLPKGVGLLPRGAGRAYGDAAINDDGIVVMTDRMRRMLRFSPSQRKIEVEAGMSIGAILSRIVPQGMFLPVVPGTQFVTVGGAIASDVHGKNQHHVGDFGHHVEWFDLTTPRGNVRAVPGDPFFISTLGGMGLTGLITKAGLKLKPIETPYILAEHRAGASLAETMELLGNSDFDDEYTVAWLDCVTGGANLGRGVAMRGHHATEAEVAQYGKLPKTGGKPVDVPFDFPSWVLNRMSVRLFNTAYYHLQKGRGRFLCNYEDFFFPLDKVLRWNRVYGRKGFVQYQCVVPQDSARSTLEDVLRRITGLKMPSFLAVLKRFGMRGAGLLSFPMPGFTLSLDLPIQSHQDQLFALLDELDTMVLAAGGRTYLAKDARMKPEIFHSMYPRDSLSQWGEIKRALDPAASVHSTLSRRLKLA